jgi:hypothetical protein
MVASSENATRFPTFQFMFAAMFVHEAGGHLLVTFLTKGRRPLTPPSMSATGFGDAVIGESGRYLEQVLFGGTMAFYRDPAQGDGQVMQPYSNPQKQTTDKRSRLVCRIWTIIAGEGHVRSP